MYKQVVFLLAVFIFYYVVSFISSCKVKPSFPGVFLDCENLIRHMLVVDLNKRYTMNQIKQHKWIIQGEPYEFLEEEDEFCYAQQHINGTENGNSAFNENIIEQMEKHGEERSAILEVILKFVFIQPG